MTTFIGTPVSSAGQSGRYTNEENLNKCFGSENIRIWSNVDNTTDTKDSDRILAALNNADTYIDDALRSGEYLIPLEPINSSYGLIERIATLLAGYYLYEPRGFDDESSEEQNKLSTLYKDAMIQLAKIQSRQLKINCVKAKTFPTGPAVV